MPLLTSTPTIAGSIGEIMTTVSTVVSTVTSNELFMIFASAGILAIGIRTVKKLIGRY